MFGSIPKRLVVPGVQSILRRPPVYRKDFNARRIRDMP